MIDPINKTRPKLTIEQLETLQGLNRASKQYREMAVKGEHSTALAERREHYLTRAIDQWLLHNYPSMVFAAFSGDRALTILPLSTQLLDYFEEGM